MIDLSDEPNEPIIHIDEQLKGHTVDLISLRDRNEAQNHFLNRILGGLIKESNYSERDVDTYSDAE